jgi:hypothetical protein
MARESQFLQFSPCKFRREKCIRREEAVNLLSGVGKINLIAPSKREVNANTPSL